MDIIAQLETLKNELSQLTDQVQNIINVNKAQLIYPKYHTHINNNHDNNKFDKRRKREHNFMMFAIALMCIVLIALMTLIILKN